MAVALAELEVYRHIKGRRMKKMWEYPVWNRIISYKILRWGNFIHILEESLCLSFYPIKICLLNVSTTTNFDRHRWSSAVKTRSLLNHKSCWSCLVRPVVDILPCTCKRHCSDNTMWHWTISRYHWRPHCWLTQRDLDTIRLQLKRHQ